MNEPMEPMNPMNQMGSPSYGGGPVNPGQPNGPIYEEETNYTRIYQIVAGAIGVLLLISIVFIVVFYQKANRGQAYIDSVVGSNLDKQKTQDRDSCDQEIKDIKENPWTDFEARNEFGAFKFVVPRTWNQHEHFDINSNNPYIIYFNPDIIKYDANLRKIHTALEVNISKKLYTAEIKDLKEELKRSKDPSTEEPVIISNITGTKFVYKDKDLGRKVGVIILPYRDRAMFIKTDDYDKWNAKYYDKFYKSFAITP